MARNALEAVAMNSSTLIYGPFRRCCRNSDNLNLNCQLPDVARYQSRRNLRQSGGHAECDAFWPAARGLRFDSPLTASVASRGCTRRKVAQRLSSPWQRSRLRCRVPGRKIYFHSSRSRRTFLFLTFADSMSLFNRCSVSADDTVCVDPVRVAHCAGSTVQNSNRFIRSDSNAPNNKAQISR